MNWREELKPGDKVIVSNRFGRSVGTVKRTTQTLVEVETGKHSRRFMKSSGYLYGGSTYSTFSLCQGTPEEIERVRLENRMRRLTAYLDCLDWRKFPLAFVDKVYQMVKEEEIHG